MSIINQNRQLTATQRAAAEIRELIFSGELVADSNHLESELADRLGISRTPVREATLMLQASGLLEVQPRKGVRISAITVEDINEISFVLSELKCLAVRLAAERGYSEEELKPVSIRIDALEEAKNNNQKETWARAKINLLEVLVDLSGNKRIAEVVTRYSDQLRRVWRIVIRMDTIPEHSIAAYRDLYSAILAGDASSADKILRLCYEQDREFLMNIFKKSNLTRV